MQGKWLALFIYICLRVHTAYYLHMPCADIFIYFPLIVITSVISSRFLGIVLQARNYAADAQKGERTERPAS